MIVIFGNGVKEFIEADGKFYCPKCKFMQVYNVKTTKNYFQLFFILIIRFQKNFGQILLMDLPQKNKQLNC